MTTILFVLSLTGVIYYIVRVVSTCMGNSMTVPAPFLHLFDISFANAYIVTPAIMYQVYFWAVHFNLIEALYGH